MRSVQGKVEGGASKARSREEEQHCIAFGDWLRLQSNMIPMLRQVIHIPNGGVRPSRVDQKTGARYSVEGAKLKRMGAQAGAWDYFVACVRYDASDGTFTPGMWIEFKSKKGVLSEAQEDFGERQRKHGYATAVVREWTEARDVLLEYFGIPDWVGRVQ